MKIYNFSVKIIWVLSMLLIFTSCEEVIVSFSRGKYLKQKYGMLKGRDYTVHGSLRGEVGVVLKTTTPEPIYFKVYNGNNPLIPRLEDDFSYNDIWGKEATTLLNLRLKKISPKVGVAVGVSNSATDGVFIRGAYKYIPFSKEVSERYRLNYMTIGINCYFNYKDSVQKSKQIVNEAIAFMKEYRMYGDIDCAFFTDSLLIKYHSKIKNNPYPFMNWDMQYQQTTALDSWVYKWNIVVPANNMPVDKSRLLKKVIIGYNTTGKFKGYPIYAVRNTDSLTLAKQALDSIYVAHNTDTVLEKIFYPMRRNYGNSNILAYNHNKYNYSVLISKSQNERTLHYVKNGYEPVNIYKYPSVDSQVVYKSTYPEIVFEKKYNIEKRPYTASDEYDIKWMYVQYDTSKYGYVQDENLRSIRYVNPWWHECDINSETYEMIDGFKFYPISKNGTQPVRIFFQGNFPDIHRINEQTAFPVFSKPVNTILPESKFWMDNTPIVASYLQTYTKQGGIIYRFTKDNSLNDKRISYLQATHIGSFSLAHWGGNPSIVSFWVRVILEDGKVGFVDGYWFK